MQKPDTPMNSAGWRFDNSYSRLPELLFTREKPLPVRYAGLTLFNDAVAAELGLNAELLRDTGAPIFAGNELPPGADPLAQAYAGHQFGHFTNLGDGRAILLGEQLTPSGNRVDVQLKGSGRTRYSRGGDGRAVLGPMLREYVISEGMHALGIPTTRSLAVAATGETVLRSKPLPGAILTRVAASHLRVGTFQYAAALGDRDLLATLLDYAIARHDPELAEADEPPLAFLEAVVERQASLVARWMLVGFVHGVMNTDNMAVSGETIDYGPCAFLDVYHPDTVFSSIDHGGRYAFTNQLAIAQWNLARLAESLLPLVTGEQEQAIQKLVAVLETFAERYARHHLAGARAKLGLATADEGDAKLFADLLGTMQQAEADFTATFVALARVLDEGPPSQGPLATAGFASWLDRWQQRLAQEPGSPVTAVARMRQVNPVIIPRNLRVEEALTAAEAGDLAPVNRLLGVIRKPFEETQENEQYRDGTPPGSPAYCTFCGT
jgi:uncharacterized protein YdiU (UPF0061 family)